MWVKSRQRGLIYTEHKPICRRCKMCYPFFCEFRVIPSASVLQPAAIVLFMHHRGCNLEFWPWLASSPPKQEEGARDHPFLVVVVLRRGCWAASRFKFQLLFIRICILQIIITQIMHCMQIGGPVLISLLYSLCHVYAVKLEYTYVSVSVHNGCHKYWPVLSLMWGS
jgi:hypothetical protein